MSTWTTLVNQNRHRFDFGSFKDRFDFGSFKEEIFNDELFTNFK